MQNSVFPFSAGCIQRHERNRTSDADCGTSEVAGAVPMLIGDAESGAAATSFAVAGAGAAGCGVPDGPGPDKVGGALLKLNPNGFLQCA